MRVRIFPLLPVLYGLRVQTDEGLDRSFSPKNWTEGEELLLTIQASFAREFPTAECTNVLLEPYCSAARVELLMIEGNCSRLRAKPAHISGHLPIDSTERINVNECS